MIETAALAASVVTLITPYLGKVGEGAATKLGEKGADVGIRALGWLRNKLSGRASEALVDLERDPGSADNKADLRKQLKQLLDTDPSIQAELAELVAGAPEMIELMGQHVTGAGAKAAQIKGDHNTTTIS